MAETYRVGKEAWQARRDERAAAEQRERDRLAAGVDENGNITARKDSLTPEEAGYTRTPGSLELPEDINNYEGPALEPVVNQDQGIVRNPGGTNIYKRSYI